MRIALAQIDTMVGDFAGNAAKMVEQAGKAAAQGAELVVFPELTLCGYPPKDLLELDEFVAGCRAALDNLASEAAFRRVPALVGFPERHGGPGAGLFNAVALLRGGAVEAIARKCLLPTYDVFDEARYFDAATQPSVMEIGGVRVGVTICEDLWNDKQFWRQPRYLRDPIEELAGARRAGHRQPLGLPVRGRQAAGPPRDGGGRRPPPPAADRDLQPRRRERLADLRRPLDAGPRRRRGREGGWRPSARTSWSSSFMRSGDTYRRYMSPSIGGRLVDRSPTQVRSRRPARSLWSPPTKPNTPTTPAATSPTRSPSASATTR